MLKKLKKVKILTLFEIKRKKYSTMYCIIQFKTYIFAV